MEDEPRKNDKSKPYRSNTERRGGEDTRSEKEKKEQGERRSGRDRRE